MHILQKVNSRGLDINLAIVLLGITSQISQIVLLRELLVIFFGNELSLGIIFFSWLFWVGIGSIICGVFSKRINNPALIFAFFSILISIVLPIQTCLIRFSRCIINVHSGGYIPITSMGVLSFTTLSIICLLFGIQFVLGTKIYDKRRNTTHAIGNVYILESIGSISGGLLFTFILVHVLNSFQIIFLLGIANLLISLFLLRSAGYKAGQVAAVVCIFVFIILLASGDFINRDISRRQWRIFNEQFTLVESRDSKYGNISVLRYREQYNFYENGSFLFSVPDVESVSITAHLAMVQHKQPERILLIGGGISGVLREVLKHPVKSVDYIELDPLIINLAIKYIPPTDLKALMDKRIQILYTDGRFYVKGCRKRYDMVIVSIPDPSTATINRFYTMEFFREVKDILKKDGVLVTGLSSADNYFGEELLSRNGSVYNAISKVFAHVLVTPGNSNYFYATDAPNQVSLDIGVLKMRFMNRNIESQNWTEHHYELYLPVYEVNRVNKSLKDSGGFINRDSKPITYYFHVVLWNLWSNTGSFKPFNWLLGIKGLWIMPIAIFLLSSGVLLSLFNKRAQRMKVCQGWIKDIDKRYSILLAIFTTGMGGIILEIVLMLLFQSLYGYVYQKVGLIIAIFMSGLLIGSAVFNNIRRRNRDFVSFIVIQAVFYLFAFVIPFIYEYVSSIISPIVIFFQYSALILFTGFLVGAEFILACNLYLKHNKEVGKTSGVIYGADIIGGCIGSLVGGSILIPILGIFNACYFVGIMGIVSFIILVTSFISLEGSHLKLLKYCRIVLWPPTAAK